MTLAAKCNYNKRARTLAAREAGCPLDHCECGTHDTEQAEHKCPPHVEPSYECPADCTNDSLGTCPPTGRGCNHGPVCDDCEAEAAGDADDACPGCGCRPGEGVTATCNHPEGCGYSREYTLDGEPVELAGLLAANNFEPAEISAITSLQPGQSYTVGGGAAAEFLIQRVR